MLRFPSPPLNLIGVLVVLLLLCGVFVGSAHSYKAWDDSGVGFRPTPRQGAGGTLNKADGLEICNKVRWSTKIPQSYCSNYHSQLPGSATEQECLDACGPDCTAVSYHPDVEFCYIVRGACRHRGHDAFYTFVKEPACDEESEAVAESRVLMSNIVSASIGIKERFKAISRRSAGGPGKKQKPKATTCEPGSPVWDARAADIACGDRITFHSGPSNPGGALTLMEAKLLVAQTFPTQCGSCAGEEFLKLCRTALKGCYMCRPIFEGANLTCLQCDDDAANKEPVNGRCDAPPKAALYEMQYTPAPKVKVGKYASQELPRAGRPVSYTHLTLPTIYSV